MIPKLPEHVAMITDNQQLSAFTARMHKAPYLAVDTEFQRERTYYPQLCLVQIAGLNEIGLIDALAIDDLGALAGLLGASGPLKVFHAADQDIEVLYQVLETVPAPLVDTQIAAALTGIGDQISYARLVETLTGTVLPKAHTRTDWTRRPLPEQVLAYAADDVRYLAAIHPLLEAKLQALGRTAWAESEYATLTAPVRLAHDPASAWRRVHAWRQLEPAQQQTLAALAQWREQQAMHANRPRKWIMADDTLVALARRQPATMAALDDVRSLASKTAARHGAGLLATIARATEQPAVALAPDSEPLTGDQKKICKIARRALTICARNADIPAPMLARRKELEQLVSGERDLKMLHGWRAEAGGQAILDVVEGRRQISGNGDDARLIEVPS